MSPPPNFPAFLASPEKRQQEQGGGRPPALSRRAGTQGLDMGEGSTRCPEKTKGSGARRAASPGGAALTQRRVSGRVWAEPAGGASRTVVPGGQEIRRLSSHWPLSPRTGVPHAGTAWPLGRWQGGQGWRPQEWLRSPAALSHLPQGPAHQKLTRHQGRQRFYLVLWSPVSVREWAWGGAQLVWRCHPGPGSTHTALEITEA